MIGYSFAFTGDINKAFTAAGRIYKMLDRSVKLRHLNIKQLKVININEFFCKICLYFVKIQFSTTFRVPLINSGDSVGLRLGEVKGNINFNKANFTYPTR